MSEPFEFPEFFDYPPYFTCVSRRCRPSALGPVSYTHLTLPTILLV